METEKVTEEAVEGELKKYASNVSQNDIAKTQLLHWKSARATEICTKIGMIMYLMLPILVIGFCCWFFNHVFNRTMERCAQKVPPVQILAQDVVASNSVVNALETQPGMRILKDALTDRLEIVKEEHDKFRAELATWLSVFGLLSIIATLIVPACAYFLQQKEFDKLQKSSDNQREEMEKIKTEVQEIRDEVQEIRDEVKDTQREVNTAKSEVTNTAEALDNGGIEEVGVANNGCSDGNGTDDLKSLLYRFKVLWGYENTEEKLQAGLKLFVACNSEIDAAIKKRDFVRLNRSINVLNNANAYLGTSNLREFKPRFVERLKMKRPLTHSFEQVNDIIKDKHPQAGFYLSVLKLQGFEPAMV